MTPDEEQIYLDTGGSNEPLISAFDAAYEYARAGGIGSAASNHWAGAQAREIIETARQRFADLIGANPEQLILSNI